MTSTLSGEIRAILGGGAEEDRVAVSHFVVGAAFLVLGSLLSVVSFLTLRFPELPLSFGRLEPVVNLILILGFGVTSLLGGVYYVLPRLTGARLWNPRFAALGLAGITGLVLLGGAVVLAGWGSGRYPFGLPWWLDVPMVGVLAVPFLVTMRTLADREEKYSYVTIWFVIGGTTWLPLLHAAHTAGHAPFISSVARAHNDLFLTAGLITMVIFVLGSGLFYYTTVRELDVPLANRSLAQVGFWSLAFASVWWGVAQLTFGPGPAWLAGVAAALGLAFPIGAVANAANGAMTLEGSWGELEAQPGVRAGILGLFLAAGVAVLAALGGFRSLASIVSLTTFWKGVEYAAVAGVAALLAASVAFSAVPRLVGRGIADRKAPSRFIRMTITGSLGVLVSLAAAGLVSGYSWVAGSNSGTFVDAGEGWGAGYGGMVDLLLLLALIFSVVTLIGHASYASTVLGTIVKGPAREQELLVSVMEDGE